MTDTTPLFSVPATGIGLVEFNRPSGANRIEVSDLRVLHDLLSAWESDPQAHVLIFAARGRHFCSGFDLRALLAQARSEKAGAADGSGGFEILANRIEATRLITIAAISGPVMGGGTDLALACDFRLGTPQAYMQMPAAQFGLPLYSGALQRYVSRLGLNWAKHLVLTASRVNAAEMVQMGFLARLVEADDLNDECLRLATELASMPGNPMSAMKQGLNAAAVGNGNSDCIRKLLGEAFDGKIISSRIARARTNRSSQRRG